jgi:hypothetical protein
MVSQKAVTPVKTGVQPFSIYPKALGSGFVPDSDPGFA